MDTDRINRIARALCRSARLDPDTALGSLTPGSNIGQGFDHLRDRNLDLIRNHRDDLERPAQSSFPH